MFGRLVINSTCCTSLIIVASSVYGDLGVAPPFLSDLEQQPPSVKTMHWIGQDIQVSRDQIALTMS